MADLFGAIGDAAEPLSGALDFLAPQTSVTPGQGFSLGSLLKSVGQGARDVVGQGPGALAGGVQAALDFDSGMSARDRLLVGGLTALGAGMAARQIHTNWKQTLDRSMIKAAPAGYGELLELGERRRFAENLSPAGVEATRRYPGVNLRQAEILGAVDYDGVMRGIRRWDVDNPAAETQGKRLFLEYSNRVGSSEAAQVDWARFDLAVERGVLTGKSNDRIRGLWRKLTSSPESMTPSETEELFGAVSAVSDATQFAGHDFSVGIVGRIERIEMSPNGPILYTRHPTGWVDGSAVDPVVRTKRLETLNYRQLADRGKQILRSIYEMGMADWTRGEGAPRRLPADLEVGPEWYPTARRDVAKAFGYEDVDSDRLERAVAAVSFLSEAEDWSTNIEKARRVMQNKAVQDEVLDGDFQSWIRQGKSHVYAGSRGADHQKAFNEIHRSFTSAGFKVSQKDLGVVLRLVGEQESVAQIFATTERRKQKNFYLNIYRPELEFPVTIDRHAFDAFLGIDTGITDRPIDLSMSDGDTVYDVVGDTYRSLAKDLGVLPHQLQAVVWETWRMLKQDAPRNGWAKNDPFMWPEADGSTNAIYEALNGRDVFTSPGSLGGRPTLVMPADVLRISEAGGIASAALPDGTVAHIADINDESAAKLRQFYPAVLGDDRVPRWVPIRPNPVQSVTEVRRALMGEPAARGESFLSSELAQLGGHPLLSGTDTITFDVEPNGRMPRLRALHPIQLGRFESDEAEFLVERLDPDTIDPNQFVDLKTSPLTTHQWVAISAVTPDGDRTRELFAELKRKGYNPIEQRGRYTMDDGSVSEETSFLVFGMPTDEGIALGSKYGQESVLIPQGLAYSDGTGRFMPQEGLEFDIPDGADGTTLVLGGQEVRFSFDFDWSSEPEMALPGAGGRTTRVRRKVAVQLPPRSQRNLVEVADELEKLGARNVSIYTKRPRVEGWNRAVEHLYDDGIQTYALRTEKGGLTSPNSGFVFTRNIDGLPKAAPLVPSRPGTVDDLLPTLPVPARKSGKKWILEPEGDEVSGAIEAKALLEQHGEKGPFEIRTPAGKFEFPNEPTAAARPTILLKNGSFAPGPRRTSPMPDWERDFGFEFDPGYRVGNQLERLDDRTVAGLRGLTETLFGEYEDAFRRWRLPRVTVSPSDGKQYAYIEWGGRPGGAIILAKEWWSDQPAFMADLRSQRTTGKLAKGADVSPESILAHEYGHMVHGAIVANQGFVKNPQIDKDLRQLVAPQTGEKRAQWHSIARQQISTTASREPAELVAEAFSEVYAGNPSRLSKKVVDLVNDRLQSSMKFRKVVGF